MPLNTEEADQKDRNIQERADAEKDLDELNSEVDTMHVIKKAVQVLYLSAPALPPTTASISFLSSLPLIILSSPSSLILF